MKPIYGQVRMRLKPEHRDGGLEIHRTGQRGKGAPGALVTGSDDESATPWGPQAKKQWAPVCKKH